MEGAVDETPSEILDEQIAYYRARAPEYDQWFFRQGRYDQGEDHRRRWFAEVAEVEAALAAAGPTGNVLELACGTGLWTRHLEPGAMRLTAIDASPEVIAINRARLASRKIEYVEADLFQWDPSCTYDFIFFGFWLSHVPAREFDAFWHRLKKAAGRTGTIFFVDSGSPQGTAGEPEFLSEEVTARRLNDGTTFRIVKIFYDAAELAERLATLGWDCEIRTTPNFFLYGRLTPR
jgi:demethylmenaquinone methyltransferase/2-methoxy-6-polyprenyl-1,4-benzoquinol methylase